MVSFLIWLLRMCKKINKETDAEDDKMLSVFIVRVMWSML